MFAINGRKFVTHVKEGFTNTFLSRHSVWIGPLTVGFIFKAFYLLCTREKCAYQKLISVECWGQYAENFFTLSRTNTSHSLIE